MEPKQSIIKSLIESLDSVTRDKQRNEKQYVEKLIQLQREIKQRDNQIMILNQKILSLSSDNQKQQQKIKTVQSYLRERSLAINTKDLKITQLQQQLKEAAFKLNQQLLTRIIDLQSIVTMQQQQLQQDLNSHQNYLIGLQEVHSNNRTQHQQRQILYSFNHELQRQIQEIQNTNECLITSCEGIQRQLRMQNQQGNDMLCQIEGMVYCVEERC